VLVTRTDNDTGEIRCLNRPASAEKLREIGIMLFYLVIEPIMDARFLKPENPE